MGDKPVYRAIFERDDNGSWFVRVPEVQGAHSHGRTLSRAVLNIREAVAVALDVEQDEFEIEQLIRLPDEISGLLDYVDVARAQAEEARERAVVATNLAASRLAEMGLSVRDTANLVGISFQRVQQLRHESPAAEPTQILDLMKALKDSVESTTESAARRASRTEAG